MHRDKCVFMIDSVEYFGCGIHISGLYTSLDKVNVVQEAQHQRNFAVGVEIFPAWVNHCTI